jgi:hypothetical protein
MYAVPLPEVDVTVAPAVRFVTTDPYRTRHGRLTEQFGPTLSVVADVREVGSGAFSTDPLVCASHVFTATHPYTFTPGAASVLKNISPTRQVAGSAVPVRNGRTSVAVEKSTFLLWVFRSVRVCGRPIFDAIKSNPAIRLTMICPRPHDIPAVFPVFPRKPARYSNNLAKK